jgi:hypothetical protein
VVVQKHHQAEAHPGQLPPASQQAERHRQRSPQAERGGHGRARGHSRRPNEPAFRLDRLTQVLLEYARSFKLPVEESMASISKELLQSIAEVLARVPVDPADLPSNVAQLGSQLDGLAGLDDLDLQNVEPATMLLPPTEVHDGR